MASQRYLLYLSYIGTNFRGSQIQNAGNVANVKPTIQGALESGLCKFLGLSGFRPIKTYSSSRTDGGVHALKTSFHVDIPIFVYPSVNTYSIKTFLNNYFNNNRLEIQILEVCEVSDKFHAKYSAVEKTYMYRVACLKPPNQTWKKSQIKIPILEYYRTFFNRLPSFDIEKAKKVCELYIGVNDFGAVLSCPSKNVRATVCDIKSVDIKEAGPIIPGIDPLSDNYDFYHITVTGNRFLYCMIRRMVGVLLCVAGNFYDLEKAENLFKNPVPSSWISKTLIPPGYGLYLLGPVYKPEDLVFTEEEREEKKAQFWEERKLKKESEIQVDSNANMK